ncbi:MAG: hypothetical protein BWY36_00931 [Candidatus Diapherotrites archaeon ADurb.Bin253]|jgi:biotin operon repressor|nr:MAG: hypothetical protein BWY36_00931 [Candidatus Diapherotrites archaeon ADurb.Bin253]
MSGWTISHIIIPGEVDFNPNLSDKDKRVYGYISNLCNRSKGCNYSNKKIALLLNCKEQTISNSINKLKEEGYLLVEILKEHDSDSGYYQIRKIRLNPKMSEIYQPLVIAFNEISNLKNYEGAINILISTYKKINKHLLKNYKENIKNLIIKEIREEIENKENTSSKEEVTSSDELGSVSSQTISSQTTIKKRTKTKTPLQAKNINWSKLHHKNKKEITPLKTTADIEDIFSYWADHYKLPIPKIGTKSYNKSVSLTKSLLKKYTPDKIKEVISNFYIAATDDRYEPSSPDIKLKYQKMPINSFIHQEFPTPYSLFEKYLNPPRMIGAPVEDKYPIITNKLITLYRKNVLGNARTKLSTKDENCFRKAAIMLKEFQEENKKKFTPYINVTDISIAEYLFESIIKSSKDESKIMPHWFCSEHNINKTLPAYMYHQGIIEESKESISPLSRFWDKSDVRFDLYDD